MAACVLFAVSACQKTIEEKAEEDAKEYTRKFCPTPVKDNTRTDSVVFHRATRTYHYYCTLTGKMDSGELIRQNNQALTDGLAKSIAVSVDLNQYKDAGFNFAYTCHSESEPSKVLYHHVFKPSDYSPK